MPTAFDTTFVRLLDVEPDLAAGLTGDARALAHEVLIARVEPLQRGRWQPEAPERPDSHLGFLIVDGVVFRRLPFADRESVELLGPGDLLVPWHEMRSSSLLDTTARWTVVEPGSVAVLDGRITGTIGRWPQVVAAVVGRALERSRAMALTLGIAQMPGAELRVLATLWDLAERFGYREADRWVVPIRLTQPMFAALVRAQRTTVSHALARLAELRLAERRADGYWVLRGELPEGLSALQRALSA
jgi:hypothetical protein